LKLLVITCWCGGQEYADMTAKMLADLQASIPEGVDWRLGLFSQGVPDGVTLLLPEGMSKITEQQSAERNHGFAVGMNRALAAGLEYFKPDYVLCINNDVEMPDIEWLDILLNEWESGHILCPTSNYTSVHEQRRQAKEDSDPIYHGVTPALCWLLPIAIVNAIQGHLGKGKLFPEDLGGRAWGEDNYTSGVVRTLVNPVPFKIVPRSWIKHLGAKTSSVIPADEKMKCHREAHRRMKAEGFK
jgi:hypothetical protein